MNLLDTSTLTNQSIAASTILHTYTATKNCSVMVRVFIDQLSANTGTRQVWINLKRGGVGSEYRVHLITQSASIVSSLTSIFSYYGPIPLANTDQLKVWAVGVAGDTTTTDIITEIWEENYTLDTVWTSAKADFVDGPISTVLRPTVEGRTLDVTATGAAGMDWGNVENQNTTVVLLNSTVQSVVDVSNATVGSLDAAAIFFSDEGNLNGKIIGMETNIAATQAKTDNLPTDPADQSLLEAAIAAIPSAPSAAVVADAVWDEALSGHVTTGTAGKNLTDLSSSGGGGGAILETVTVTVSGLPRDGVQVWVTTDQAGLNVVANGVTDALGEVDFMLDVGTYYVWKQVAGVNFTNPQTMAVS